GHEINVPGGYVAPASGTAVDLHKGRGGLLDPCLCGGMSPGKCQAPDPCPIADKFGAARAGASRGRRLDAEVEPVGGNVQLGRRFGTNERDPVVPDHPGIGPTHPDEATLVGAEFPEAPWGQPGGAGVEGPPSGEDEPLAGPSHALRVPDVGL